MVEVGVDKVVVVVVVFADNLGVVIFGVGLLVEGLIVVVVVVLETLPSLFPFAPFILILSLS